MRTERLVFWFLAAFFLVVAPIYWFMSHEVAGSIALLFAGLLGVMIAGYLTITARSFDDRPEDREDAEVVEGAGDVGFFPPKSTWPVVCAAVVSIIFLGPAFHQVWISLLGFGIGIWAASGWVLEFYRGDYKH